MHQTKKCEICQTSLPLQALTAQILCNDCWEVTSRLAPFIRRGGKVALKFIFTTLARINE